MSLPPERISVKRRRQEEPVETLILDHGAVPNKKKRFTEFFFQRLRNNKTTSPNQVSNAKAFTPSQPRARDHAALGIPLVRATEPGDEVTDFQKYKVAQETKSKSGGLVEGQVDSHGNSKLRGSSLASIVPARRFHLTRDISTLLRANPAGGIRRPRAYIRPPLATFIERHPAPSIKGPESIHRAPPVDSILEVKNTSSTPEIQVPLHEASILRRTPVNSFLKSDSANIKSGNSIRDDPTTWDQDSDQLANELAALAFDIDPGDAIEPPLFEPSVMATAAQHATVPVLPENDEDFVLETYIRVKRNPDIDVSAYASTEVGVLVIDDENEDLWEKYIHDDDDDDEWNEEDEDSNAEDNPRNEYPDDEVSTDDEYGHNVYNHRRNASDNEEFDEARDGW